MIVSAPSVDSFTRDTKRNANCAVAAKGIEDRFGRGQVCDHVEIMSRKPGHVKTENDGSRLDESDAIVRHMSTARFKIDYEKVALRLRAIRSYLDTQEHAEGRSATKFATARGLSKQTYGSWEVQGHIPIAQASMLLGSHPALRTLTSDWLYFGAEFPNWKLYDELERLVEAESRSRGASTAKSDTASPNSSR